MKTESLDDLFESVADANRKQAALEDTDKARLARIEAKIQAETEKQIRQGIRDENGDWIEDEEE